MSNISMGQQAPTSDRSTTERPEYNLKHEIRDIDLSKLRAFNFSIYSIFKKHSALQIQLIESYFGGNLHDNFSSLQYRLWKAQEPRIPELLQIRELFAKSRPKPNRTKRLCFLLGILANDPNILDPVVRDGFFYLQAICLGWVAFYHHPNNISQVIEEVKAMAGDMDPVKFYEMLVEASERYLQAVPTLTDVNRAAISDPIPIRSPKPDLSLEGLADC